MQSVAVFSATTSVKRPQILPSVQRCPVSPKSRVNYEMGKTAMRPATPALSMPYLLPSKVNLGGAAETAHYAKAQATNPLRTGQPIIVSGKPAQPTRQDEGPWRLWHTVSFDQKLAALSSLLLSGALVRSKTPDQGPA